MVKQFYRELNCLHYGNIATLHVCTGNGTVCNAVTLRRYMLYREWNCLQYGNIASLHAYTETGTVCITVTLRSYMFVQGMELSAIR